MFLIKNIKLFGIVHINNTPIVHIISIFVIFILCFTY